MAEPGEKAQQQFSASISLASDEDLKVYCIPCDRAGPRLPAFGFCHDCDEHLCQTCFNHHKKATLSMHHVLLDKGAMPKTIKHSSKSAHVRKPDDFTQPCFKHKKKMIEFYCQDHKVLLCSACVTLEHTGKSCHVDYIPDISGQVVDSQEFKDILKYLDDIIQHCQKVKTECKKVIEKSNSSLSEVLKEIKKYRHEINKQMDELENEMENKAKDLQQQNTQKLHTTGAVCDDVSKSVKALSDDIKRDNTSKQADKLFIGLKTAEVEIKEHETCINDLTTSGPGDVNSYHFKPNPTISTVLQKETYLGTLEEKILSTPIQKLNIHVQKSPTSLIAQTPTKLLSAICKTNEFSFQDEICVKTRNDEKTCWITGISLLNPDQLFVADCKNMSVKLVDVNSKTVSSAITLSSSPYGIASVTSNQLAVTLPLMKQIQFLSVSYNKLSKAHTLNVDGDCHGICYYHNKFVVSYSKKLEILNIKGTALKKVTTNASGISIFKKPRYVQVNSNSIYVSDWETKTVTLLNWQGREMGSYGGFGYCEGLALSADGTVFVCDWSNNSITEISGDCNTGKVVIQDVNKPQALCWCDKSHKLYISRNTNSEDGYIIRVYNKSQDLV